MSVTLITIAARTLLAFLTTVSVVMSMFNKLVFLKELQSSHRQFNSPTPTRRHIKSSRDVGELVFNPGQLIKS